MGQLPLMEFTAEHLTHIRPEQLVMFLCFESRTLILSAPCLQDIEDICSTLAYLLRINLEDDLAHAH